MSLPDISQPEITKVDSSPVPPPMGDLYPYETHHSIHAITVDQTDPQLLHLDWSDGWRQSLHALWLREQCPCAECRHPASLERLLDQEAYSLDLQPEQMSITGRQTLSIIWPDGGHASAYQACWLRHQGRPPVQLPKRQPWGADLAERLPRFDFAAVVSDESALLAWLESLRRTGLSYVVGAPTTPGTVRELAGRIGNVRDTNFGDVFQVVAQADGISNAYTAVELPLHVDLPAREYQPGLQFLHCLVNETKGGNSLYCDGLHLAEHLRARDRTAFEILAKTPILFRYHDEGCDYQMHAPLIGLDDDGEIGEIRFNPSVMTTADCPQSDFRAYQDAYRKFLALTKDPHHRLETRMRAGEIAVFDNRRILHGRKAFAEGTGRRHLQGAYVEWEDADSRIRVLRRRLG